MDLVALLLLMMMMKQRRRNDGWMTWTFDCLGWDVVDYAADYAAAAAAVIVNQWMCHLGIIVDQHHYYHYYSQ